MRKHRSTVMGVHAPPARLTRWARIRLIAGLILPAVLVCLLVLWLLLAG